MREPEVKQTSLPGVLLIEPFQFADERGLLMELYQEAKYAELGLEERIVQVNVSRSRRGVLRGLHYQLRQPQGKLLTVVHGEIFDVAVDIRRGSPTFGRWFAARLSEENRIQMFVPGTCAHGFCVLSERADVVYGCTDLHLPGDDRGLRWDDPSIDIDWPIERPILSSKDEAQPVLEDLRPEDLPTHAP